MPAFSDRLQHAWNAFFNKDPTPSYDQSIFSSSYRPDRRRLRYSTSRTIISSIYTRIALDVASISIEHVRVDENERFLEEIHSGLNNCLKLNANEDQTGRAFIQDIVMSMFDEGCVAVVPVETSVDPKTSGSIDILSLRVGKIIQWYPAHVRVEVYNARNGKREELLLPKKFVAIIENPLYAVMNEPNSTLQRLNHKLRLLDDIDEQSSSGKLDLIIQLPYVVKSQNRRDQATERRTEIANQLEGTKYGIAYIDSTEKITQLNRSIDNNLQPQIEYLTTQLYAQLGMTDEVIKGTANEQVMLNYYNRTVEPIISAIVDAFKWKFLTKTARTQGQSIMFFRDPFKLVPVANLADIGDKFARNEVLSSNEIRGLIGFKPSSDPKADQLVNSNMPQPDETYEDNSELADENEDAGYIGGISINEIE